MEPATIGRWTPHLFFLISVTFRGSLLVIVQVQQESNQPDRRRTPWEGDEMRRGDPRSASCSSSRRSDPRQADVPESVKHGIGCNQEDGSKQVAGRLARPPSARALHSSAKATASLASPQ